MDFIFFCFGPFIWLLNFFFFNFIIWYHINWKLWLVISFNLSFNVIILIPGWCLISWQKKDFVVMFVKKKKERKWECQILNKENLARLLFYKQMWCRLWSFFYLWSSNFFIFNLILWCYISWDLRLIIYFNALFIWLCQSKKKHIAILLVIHFTRKNMNLLFEKVENKRIKIQTIKNGRPFKKKTIMLSPFGLFLPSDVCKNLFMSL